MPIKFLCIYCAEPVDIANDEVVLIAKEQGRDPAEYAHIKCRQDYMRKPSEQLGKKKI